MSADHHIPWGEEGCLIDGNWHYGCVFSPRQAPYGGSLREACNDVEPNFPSANLGTSDDHPEIHICEEGGQRLGRIFEALDEDGDGRLSADEIARYLERLGLEMPAEDVELIVRSASADGNAYLTATEFARLYESICGREAPAGGEDGGGLRMDEEEEAAVCEAFEIFDQNGDGFISAVELADVLCRLRFAEGRDVRRCQRMIESVDFNGDGVVDLQEFKQLVMKNKCYCSTPPSKSSLTVRGP